MNVTGSMLANWWHNRSPDDIASTRKEKMKPVST